MIRWELLGPGVVSANWLDEVSELRGRVMYGGGRRPEFRLADGQYVDSDPLDIPSYHILARVGGKLVGCLRLLNADEQVQGLTERLLGPDRFVEILQFLGTTKQDSVEAGRWVADPDYRRLNLGVMLAVGAISTAKALGFSLLYCSVGTRGKQDRVLSRLGLKSIPDLPLFTVPMFDDELRVMYIVPNQPQPQIGELLGTIANELNLNEQVRTKRAATLL